MPRNMSFSLTTQAVRDRTKTVTRRLGWRFLKPGDYVWAVEKAQGLKKGEKVKRLALIRVVGVHGESLNCLTLLTAAEQALEMRREGFPHMTVPEFISMYTKHSKIADFYPVNRIEFEYVDDQSEAHDQTSNPSERGRS